MTTLYGIKNCDTVKKARRWLDGQGIDYAFHDLRADGLDAATVQAWLDQLGWEVVVNKRSTTWRQLDEATKNNLNGGSACALLLDNPTLIKRPVLDIDGQYRIGFKESDYQAAFE